MPKASRRIQFSVSPSFLLCISLIAAFALLVGLRVTSRDQTVDADRVRREPEEERGLSSGSSQKYGSESDLYSASPLVAVCLVGGLRQFELTGPTITKYLLSQLPGHLHTFVVTPLDADAWKVFVLGEPLRYRQLSTEKEFVDNADFKAEAASTEDSEELGQVAGDVSTMTRRSLSQPTADLRPPHRPTVMGVKISLQEDVPESNITEAGIHPRVSPMGRQGLLKYMALTESCIDLILAAEERLQRRYTHILRTRPDGLWGEAPPPLMSLDPLKFHVPPENDWYGVNDRLSFGPRDLSLKSMRRLSSVVDQVRAGEREMTAEVTFQKLLEMEGIMPMLSRDSHFQFCTLTSKSFPKPSNVDPSHGPPLVAPLGSPSARNGRYCWPSPPDPQGEKLHPNVVEFFQTRDFCNTTAHVWPKDWTQVFDRAVGEDIATARSNFVSSKNFFWCFAHLSRFLRIVPVQHGGGGVLLAEKICRLGFIGSEFDDELARIRKLEEERKEERRLATMKKHHSLHTSDRLVKVRRHESQVKRARKTRKINNDSPI